MMFYTAIIMPYGMAFLDGKNGKLIENEPNLNIVEAVIQYLFYIGYILIFQI
jgi:hypothetical protein